MNLENFLLAYGGFDIEEENIKNNYINNEIKDLVKIINYCDYANHFITKINNKECSICLLDFNNNLTTIDDIIKNLNKYKQKNTNNFNYNWLLDNSKINDSCVISCYHVFHKKCLLEWYKKNNSCPLCRTIMKKIK